MKVAVLCGGRSSEHEVSLRSGASVADGLREAGHEAVEVLIERDGAGARRRAVELSPAGGLLGADAVFPVLHGPFGEDGSVQGLLEVARRALRRLRRRVASAICMDKLTLKRLFAADGMPQVDFVAAGDEGWRERCEALGLPLWVKPSRLGSSVGISKVDDRRASSTRRSRLARRHDPRVIVEASAAAARSSARVLGNEERETSLPGEIVAHADWYDYEAKYSEGGMDLEVPAPRSARRPPSACASSPSGVFELCGCSGLARCDFFVEPDGEVLVNEINTIPGFTETSVYAQAARGERHPLPRALRPPGPAGARAPPRAALLRVLSGAPRSARSAGESSSISTW